MNLLLDENLPIKLKYRFPSSFEVLTVSEMGWGGLKNGELLNKMQLKQLSFLLTIDKNFSHQQNLKKFPIILIVLNARDNRYETLEKLIPSVVQLLKKELEPGVYNLQL